MISHSDACRRAQLAASEMGARLFRREVGLFTDLRGNPRKIGIEGEADLQGWLSDGYAFAVEVKTGKARRTTEQKRWAAAFRGVYVVARYSETENGDDTIRTAIRLRNGDA